MKTKAVRKGARRSPGPAPKVDLTSPATAAELSLPHERDETAGMTGGVASPVVQQGARDLKRGVKDTSRAVETNEAYERLKK